MNSLCIKFQLVKLYVILIITIFRRKLFSRVFRISLGILRIIPYFRKQLRHLALSGTKFSRIIIRVGGETPRLVKKEVYLRRQIRFWKKFRSGKAK